jgi:uncharacterized protein (DUF1810 family)
MGDKLERFVVAQDQDHSYQAAVAELHAGRKVSHWMWFVFPQIAGLGQSDTSQYFAIADLDEARAYLANPVLGQRLRECAGILAMHQDHDAQAILGPVDALKLCSSMTLFMRADPTETLFRTVLERFFEGRADAATDRLLDRDAES